MTNAVALAQGASNNVTMRNRIINGAMVIDQRNAGAAVTPTADAYTLDRWDAGMSQASKMTIQQSSTVPAGFSKSLSMTVASAYTPSASEWFGLYQKIEGFNSADFGFGAAGASTVTISFWVRSSIAGSYGFSLSNSAQNRSYPVLYTVNSANTWEQKTITIAGDTSGTWVGATNGIGLLCIWSLGAGSSYLQTANAWGTGLGLGTTGQTNWISTASATFYITGVQLEAGTTASPFEYRQYGTELALCQRYYWQAIKGDSQELTVGWYWSTTQISLVMNMPVPMRTGPSISQVTGTDYYAIYSAGTTDRFNSLTVENAGTTMVSLLNSTQVSGTAGFAGIVRATNASSYLGFTAEL